MTTKLKSLKPYLQQHKTGEEAVERTKKNNVIAVVVKTYCLDSLATTEFYSYKTKNEGNDLYEDFPICLGSNQSIEEIDANDY